MANDRVRGDGLISPEAYTREDESPDGEFYGFPRKVVHIDEGQLVFKAENKFYRLRCGDTLYPAIEKPLSASEVKELGLATE